MTNLNKDKAMPVSPVDLIQYYWAGAGDGNAPAATNLADFTYGVSQNGASNGELYWVINGAWVNTGASVANIHGAS